MKQETIRVFSARAAGMLSGARRVAMMLLLMVLTMTAQTAWAGSGVKYVTAGGTEMNTADGGIDVTSLNGNETEIGGGWYVVDHDITYTSPLIITGDVTLILTNGHTMSVGTSETPIIGDKECVFGTQSDNGNSHSLTIYGQSLNETQAGHLKVYAGSNNDNSPYGIKANYYIQHSGNVTSNAVFTAIFTYRDITLNGGVLNVTSTNVVENTSNYDQLKKESAMSCQNNFSVTSGQLIANSTNACGVYCDNNINISGGTVNCTGGYSGLYGLNINISGGKIDATATNDGNNYHRGIFSSNNINLGYSSSDDYIQATGYTHGGSGHNLNIIANKKFKVGDTETVLDGGESGLVLTEYSQLSPLFNQKLTPVTHTVTFSLTGGGGTVPAQTVAHGLPITVPTTAGYKLMNWKKGGESYDITTPVTEDITLTAEWVQLGDLKITNTVTSDLAADANEEFTIVVTLTNATPAVNGTYGDITFANSGATITLKGGESVTATGLLYGTSYVVTQTGKTGFVTTPNGERPFDLTVSGTLNSAEETAAFTNSRETGDLELKAVLVSDRAADADEEFTFTVELSDKTISKTYGGMTFDEGVATVTLKGGETATATGLPTTVGYTVTQAAAAGFTVTGKTGDQGTISTTKSTATFTNTRETGDLNISAVLVSDKVADADVDFTFTVTLVDNPISGTYGDMTFASGVATVTLKGGETATATGLPTTVGYTVTQAAAAGFTVTGKTGDQGTISTTESTATFTNTRETGDLNISAVLVSDKVADADVDFMFTVTLVDNPISGTYGDMTFAEGVATVTLKGGESALAEGLPTTVDYTVTQAAAAGFTLTGKTGDTGEISTTPATAAFTNTRETGDLTVSNTVYGDNTQAFEYTVTLVGTTTNGTHGGMEFENGVAHITTLTHGQPVTATGLPTDVTYTVTQTAKDGFTTTQTGNTGTITTTPATAAFKNIKLMPASVSINWKDGDGSGRPGELPVNLLSRLKGASSWDTEQSKTLEAENEWTVTIDQLPMYNNDGVEIEYSWSTITAPSGYLLDVDVSDTGADVIYTLTKATSPTLTVTWEDDDNRDGIRPTALTVTLLANGAPLDPQPEISWTKDDNWTTTVNNLSMYDGSNNLINYTWTVEAPEGYTMPDTPITTALTLSHTPETTSSSVHVNWDDDSNRDNIRPNNLTVTLLANGVALPQAQQPTITWTKYDGHWTATVSNLPKNNGGMPIAYTWTVTNDNLPTDYTLPYTDTSEGTTSLGLRHEISTTEATLQITWYDANNESSRLPVDAALYVGENPVEGKTVTLSGGNDWTATISDLPANDNGVAITYTWKLTEQSETELANAGYTSSAEPSTSGTVTTLTYRNAVAQPAFTFANSNVTTTINGSVSNELTGALENPTITYSSSNVAVAEVDASTGEVTIHGSGVTTITAIADETNNYLSATAKYTLTVTGGSTVNIQLTEDYGTFCWNQDLDFSGIDGLDAYIAAGYNASTGVLTMVKVTSVPAGTGLLLRGSAGYNYTATAQSSTWVYANLLTGTTAETSLYAGGNDFILGKKNGTIGFYPVSENGKIAANKAYLHLDNIPQTHDAPSFVSLSFDDDVTALDAVRWKKETVRGDVWYSLDGRRLQGKPTVKGLYIHNGRKETVK